MTLLLTLALSAANALSALPPALLQLYEVAWHKARVSPGFLEWKPREPAGAGIDPVTGTVVVGTREGRVLAFSPAGTPLWGFDAAGGFWAAPTIDGDTVYAGSQDGRLYAIDLVTGKERWRYEAQGEEIGSSPVLVNGVAYFASLQDTVFAVDAKTGAWRWHHRREPTGKFTIRGAAGPTVASGVVYAAYADGTVAALDAANGSVKWERNVAPKGDFTDIDSTPQLSGGRVYVGAYSGAVLALDAATGKVVWEVKAPGASRVLAAGGTVYAVALGQVLALSPRDGSQLWSVPLGGTPAGDPVLVGNRLLVPNAAALLWLDPASGRKLRVFDPGTGVSARPAVAGRRMYVVSNGGELLALDLR